MKPKTGCSGLVLPLIFKCHCRIFILFTLINLLTGNRVSAQEQTLPGVESAGQAAPILSSIFKKGLQIGETIPNELWNLPLQVINGPGGRKVITLNDFRGKLIVLDFWATWCGSCIEALPKMQHYQNDFSDQIQILPVTFQSRLTVNKFLENNPMGNTLQFPMVSDDSLLNQVFKHNLISHLIWIDRAGKVRAVTWSEYMNAQNINQVLEGKPLNWAMKNDMLSFDPTVPLLSFSDNGVPMPAFNFHSTITGHLLGVNPTSGTSVDSVRKTVRRFDINAHLVGLCVRAWGKPLPGPVLSPKQYVFEVRDKSRYIVPNDQYREEWNRVNTYCYEVVLPAGYTKEQIAAVMRDDLKRYLKVEGYPEERKMPVLVITKSSLKAAKVKGKKAAGITVEDFVWYLNRKVTEVPYAIDESGSAQSLIPDSIRSAKDPAAMEKILKACNLEIRQEDRTVNVFVIKEIN